MATAKKQAKQSEVVTPGEVIANEPTVEETSAAVNLLENEVMERAILESPREETVKAIVQKAAEPPLTEEEKILSFLEGKTGHVRINEVLKSFYGVPKYGEPAPYLQQQESRRLMGLLQNMIGEGKIVILGNRHLHLGSFYYHGDSHVQQHHNLNTLVLEAVTKN